MRTDDDIKRDIELELEWEPDVDAKNIAVKVSNGVVTLTGFVSSYSDKYEAERVAKRVRGVTAVANDLEVKLATGSDRRLLCSCRSRRPSTTARIYSQYPRFMRRMLPYCSSSAPALPPEHEPSNSQPLHSGPLLYARMA